MSHQAESLRTEVERALACEDSAYAFLRDPLNAILYTAADADELARMCLDLGAARAEIAADGPTFARVVIWLPGLPPVSLARNGHVRRLSDAEAADFALALAGRSL